LRWRSPSSGRSDDVGLRPSPEAAPKFPSAWFPPREALPGELDIHVNNVNAYHSRFKEWMRRFHGVATRNLPN
jgi:hypothetical protein